MAEKELLREREGLLTELTRIDPVTEVGAQIEGRMKMFIEPGPGNTWTAKETSSSYGHFPGP